MAKSPIEQAKEAANRLTNTASGLTDTAAHLTDAVAHLKETFHQHRLMSHATIVIAAAAVLDDLLGKAIRKQIKPLSKKVDSQMFDYPGPCSTFASRIVLAYGLDIIPKDMYVELEKIRKIRNAFAHSVKLLNLGSPAIAPTFKSMKKPPTDKTTADEVFMQCVVVIDDFLDNFVAAK